MEGFSSVPMEHPLQLRAGQLELELSPSIGGSIRNFTWVSDQQRRPILRESHTGADNVLAMASFPLVPFVNRIRDGRFDFRGREIRLQPNMAGDPSPLHGQGWLGEWVVEAQGNQDATLRYAHEAGEWPWTYEALQQFALDEGGLLVRLICRNDSDNPMPCGLGQHPYFPCSSETILDTHVTDVWEINDIVLPTVRRPAIDRYDLRERHVCGQGLDHGFAGWGGLATIRDPAWPFKIRLTSPTAGFFQLYSPTDGGIFVAEPVTHANAALNEPEERWHDLGLQVLEPGGEMKLEMRIDILPA